MDANPLLHSETHIPLLYPGVQYSNEERVLTLLSVPRDGMWAGDAFSVMLEQFVKMLS